MVLAFIGLRSPPGMNLSVLELERSHVRRTLPCQFISPRAHFGR
jgi:hypothetical protein